MPRIVSISGDQRGETALANLPTIGTGGEELRVEAGGLVKVDAYTAVVLRALVEYYGSRYQKVVTFRPPASDETWALLATLLGAGLPDYFCLAAGTSFPVGRSRAAILPARPIESLDDNDEVADGLLDLIDGDIYGHRNVALMATAFAVLGENALTHGGDSVIATLAAIAYEREASTLQLVVTDLGRGLADAEDPYEAVIDLVERTQQHGGALTAWRPRPAARRLTSNCESLVPAAGCRGATASPTSPKRRLSQALRRPRSSTSTGERRCTT